MARLVLAGVLLAAGDAAGARGELDALGSEPAVALLDLSAGRGWELLVLTHLELGDLEAAHQVAIRVQARTTATSLDQFRATAQLARSAVLLARHEPEAAAAAASEAVARAARAGNPLLAARARALFGRAAAARGERDLAVVELEAAREGLIDCGAAREAAAVARELRRLGRRIRRVVVQVSPDEGLRLLSAREREVAEHVAAGETNRGIAGALFLSEKTIESHLARMYGKLGVRSRVALAALVERERAR